MNKGTIGIYYDCHKEKCTCPCGACLCAECQEQIDDTIMAEQAGTDSLKN